MASNLDTLVTVFGGSGFLGRSVVRALAKRDYRIRVAVRRPELAGHLQPLGKVGQIHAVQANLRYPASVEAAMRDSHVAINLVGILAESGAQTFDAVQAQGRRRGGQAAAAVGAADGACLRHRRRREFALALRPLQGGRRKGGAVGHALGHHPAALGGVRARGSIHQPVRGAGTDVAGAAADRRRRDPNAAGLCRRCRDRGRRCRRRQDQGRRDLRTRRPGSADHARDHGNHPRDHRTPAHAGVAAVRPGEIAGAVPAIRAGTAETDAGSGGAAAHRQCGVGAGEGRRPDAGRLGNRAGFAGSDRAAISLALPQPPGSSRTRALRTHARTTRQCGAGLTVPSPARSGRACRR